jgi:hypothetical protein
MQRVGEGWLGVGAIRWAFVLGSAAIGCEAKEQPTAVTVASATVASATAPVAEPAPAVTCRDYCGRLAGLRCGTSAACEAACSEMTRSTSCRRELAKFLDCSMRVAVEHWECDEGLPALKDGQCEAPQAAVAACATTP